MPLGNREGGALHTTSQETGHCTNRNCAVGEDG